MRSLTAAQLEAAIYDRIDFGLTGTGYETSGNLLNLINGSLPETWGILVRKFGQNYFYRTVQFNLIPGRSSYALAPDFFKLLGVDVALDTTGLNWTAIKPYQLQNRNQYAYASVAVQPGNAYTNLKYQEQEQILSFIPGNQVGSQLIRYMYCPSAPVLVSGTQASVQVPSTTVGCGVVYTANLSGVGGNSITLTYNAPAGSSTTVAVVGNAITVSPMLNEVNAGIASAVLNSTAAVNLVSVSVVGPNDLALAAGSTPLVGGIGTTGTASFDGINGWEELLILDCLVKLAIKSDYDPTAYMSQKQDMLRRIDVEASDRQAGDPMGIVGGWGRDQGSMGGSTGWGWEP